jgi:hypothetical protein
MASALASGTTACVLVIGLAQNSWAAPAGTPRAAPPSSPPLTNLVSALLDITDERDATVVAVIKGHQWEAGSVAGKETVNRLARKGAAYHLLPSTSGAAAAKGQLTGKVREDCAEFHVALASPAAAQGFAIVTPEDGGQPVRSVKLEDVKVEPAYTAAVAGIIARATKRKIAPKIVNAYRADLDGDGKPEVILQATHPDLNGDPPKYKPQYYSLIVVLPGEAAKEPAFTGYLQAVKEMADFEVLTLDSVADVDRDGKSELLVRARHAEGWQTQVFGYDGKLNELFHSVGGEGACPGAGE